MSAIAKGTGLALTPRFASAAAAGHTTDVTPGQSPQGTGDAAVGTAATTGVASKATRVTTDVFGFVLLIALFALCHPYEGIVGDSSVYIGRILADHDPAGLGRDLLFANDGQSGFSLFRILAAPLVLALGPSPAAAIIAGAGGLCWLAGLFALARAFASGRTAWAIAILVIVLPAGYGDTGHFTFAESTAVPRPFAEAATMAALAAILAGRWRLAGAALAAAFALHPLMAAPGVGVAACLALWRLKPGRRRLALAAVAGMAGLAILAALLGAPLAERIIRVTDPDWFGMIARRGPHLFPTRWAATAASPLLAQVATIVIASRLVSASRRRLLLAVLGVAAVGLAASILLSDTLHLLLFVQLQMWRATWLLGVCGGAALALCAADLWRRDDAGRLVLALLALAWFFQPSPIATAVLAGAAVLLEAGMPHHRLRLGGRAITWVYALAGIAILYWAWGGLQGYVAFLRALPADDAPRLADPIRNGLQTIPLVILVAVWLLGPRLPPRWARPALALAATLCAAAALDLWDQRPVAVRMLEQPAPAAFAALDPHRAADVLWIDGLGEAWFALGRPQYLSAQQAVSIVFSRPLAMEWRRRAQELVDDGLARHSIMTPFATPADADRARVTPAALRRFCHRADAPGIVVVPVERGIAPPPVIGTKILTLPSPLFTYEAHASSQEWHAIEAFAAVPCRGAADRHQPTTRLRPSPPPL